jgi:hypothetical protein
MAVWKYQNQGLKAWTTYTSGAYLKFLQPASSAIQGGQALVDEALQFLGTPYVWGGDAPGGFDCSGLVQYCLEQVGLKNVPRTSEEQWAWVQKISYSQLKPGDLIFEQWPGDESSPGHVVIYAGNGQIVQAPETGEDVEQVAFSPSLVASQGGTIVGYGRPPGLGSADYTGSGSTGSSGSDVVLTSATMPSWANAIPVFGPSISGLWTFFGDIGQATGLAAPLEDIANTIKTFEDGVAWFFVPSHWVRIGCGIGGSVLVLLGIVTMTRTGRPYTVQNPVAGMSAEGVSVPSSLPAPGGQIAPAVGIAEVTLGCIGLFVAFHNLPVNVETFSDLIGYLQGELQRGGKDS